MREHPHHTPDKIVEYISDALALLDKLNVPDDLREIVFAKAVDLQSAKQVFYSPEEAAPLNSGARGILARGMQ